MPATFRGLMNMNLCSCETIISSSHLVRHDIYLRAQEAVDPGLHHAMHSRIRADEVLAAQRELRQQEVHGRPPAILIHVGLELLLRAGTAVVSILRHIGAEVRVQTARRAMQRSAHVVADEQVVEDAVPYSGHQRVARRLERQAASLTQVQIYPVVLAADPQIDEAVCFAEVLYLLEIAGGFLRVVLLEFVTPAVVEVLRFMHDLRRRTGA